MKGDYLYDVNEKRGGEAWLGDDDHDHTRYQDTGSGFSVTPYHILNPILI